jgi:hypothetical protein
LFGDIWMWSPIITSLFGSAAGVAGLRSPEAACAVLPVIGALYALNGVIGTHTHLRSMARKPGGLCEPTYNLVTGAPLLVGSIAMLAEYPEWPAAGRHGPCGAPARARRRVAASRWDGPDGSSAGRVGRRTSSRLFSRLSLG